MRAAYYRFALSTVSTTGIATGLTGTGPWTTFTRNDIPDGLAHKISLTSTANLSAINITITGTDADGNAITETRAGPNNNTVSTTAFFKTVTNISAASTLGANTMNVGWIADAVSKSLPLDHYARRPASVQVTISGTAAVDIAGTLSDIRDGGIQSSWTWLNDANFTNKSASLYDDLSVAGIRAIRLEVNSYSTGAIVSLDITQPR